VEQFEERCLLNCTLPFPDCKRFIVMKPRAGLIATIDKPDGGKDVRPLAFLTYRTVWSPITIIVGVRQRGDGRLDILNNGIVPFGRAGTINAVIHLTQYDPDEPAPEGVEQFDVRTTFYVSPTDQPTYGPLPRPLRVPLGSSHGAHRAWIAEAMRRLDVMNLLLNRLGVIRDSIIRPGDHSHFKMMDVDPTPDTTWDELAAAASQAGFWVHAVGVNLDGRDWPLTPGATEPHLELYLERGRAR
jgi:hypothetical protein